MKHRKREKVKQSKESRDWPLAPTIIKLKFQNYLEIVIYCIVL